MPSEVFESAPSSSPESSHYRKSMVNRPAGCPGGHEIAGEWFPCYNPNCRGENTEDSERAEESSHSEDEVGTRVEELESEDMDHGHRKDNDTTNRQRNSDPSGLDVGKVLERLAQNAETVVTQNEVHEIPELANVVPSSRQPGVLSWNQGMGRQGPAMLTGRQPPESGRPTVDQIIALHEQEYIATNDERDDAPSNHKSVRSPPGFKPANLDPYLRQLSGSRTFGSQADTESTTTRSDTPSEAVYSASSRTEVVTPFTSPQQSRRRTNSTQSAEPRVITRYVCDTCGKTFKRPADGRKHEKCHLQEHERRFQCDECPRGFVDRKDLERHKTKHSEERAFQCNLCPKSLKRKDALLRHKQIMHPDAER